MKPKTPPAPPPPPKSYLPHVIQMHGAFLVSYEELKRIANGERDMKNYPKPTWPNGLILKDDR